MVLSCLILGTKGVEQGSSQILPPALVVALEASIPILIEEINGPQSSWKMYCQGNIPENFVLSRMSLHTLIVYWYYSSVQPHYPGFQYTKAFNFSE
jgi:hypothetical protein